MAGGGREITKPIRRQLNELVGIAHEEAMRRALAALAADFDRWRHNEIDPFELADRIHKFHNGASREIYNRFATRRNTDLPMLAAYSVVQGLIQEKDVPAEVRPFIDGWLTVLGDGRGRVS
jgi:hypothetical protein